MAGLTHLCFLGFKGIPLAFIMSLTFSGMTGGYLRFRAMLALVFFIMIFLFLSLVPFRARSRLREVWISWQHCCWPWIGVTIRSWDWKLRVKFLSMMYAQMQKCVLSFVCCGNGCRIFFSFQSRNLHHHETTMNHFCQPRLWISWPLNIYFFWKRSPGSTLRLSA